MTNGFELDHTLDLWILKVKCDLDLPHRWLWPRIFMVKFWNSCISEWEGWLTLHKGGGSRSFMTMIMTIWWPRSGVWIYQVVTGVTSVVGVPSTHLVYQCSHQSDRYGWPVSHHNTMIKCEPCEHEENSPLQIRCGVSLLDNLPLSFLHKICPVVLYNMIRYIFIKICHCTGRKTHFVPSWKRVNFTQRLRQLIN